MATARVGDWIGDYQVEAELGRGACAVVYQVRHRDRGTTHALKLLVWNSPPLRRRLAREGELQRTLRHPNLVPVDDVLIDDARCALVMERIEGPSLEQWITEHSPSLAEAERIFQGILAGLATAHAAGVVHRDLKPANVLMQRRGSLIEPRITDFGIAQAAHLGTRLTRPDAAVGTPGYMAPEQFKDARSVDMRADIYSAGCVLYQLATGHPPFSGNMAVIELAARAGDYPDPRQLVPDLPERFLRTIQGCLQPDPDLRLADCAAVRAVLAGKPAPPPARRAPLAAPTRRPRQLRALLQPLSILLALFLGVLLGVGGARTLRAPAPPLPTTSTETVSANDAVEPTTASAAAAAPDAAPPETEATPPTAAAPAASPTQETASARILIEGDVDQLWLESGGRRRSPGTVPPGTYTIRAAFSGGTPIVAGQVTVRRGETVRLGCSPQFLQCREL